MIYGHGDEIYAPTTGGLINFSSTVWTGGDIQHLKEHLIENLNAIHHYPEPDAGTLRRMLAKRTEVEYDSILVTNGPTAAFYQIAQAFRGSRSLIFTPSFSEYEDACRISEHEISFFPTDEDLGEKDFSNIDFCWLCNPNNPDGKFFQRAEIQIGRAHV